jgi:hypothetical protein
LLSPLVGATAVRHPTGLLGPWSAVVVGCKSRADAMTIFAVAERW